MLDDFESFNVQILLKVQFVQLNTLKKGFRGLYTKNKFKVKDTRD